MLHELLVSLSGYAGGMLERADEVNVTPQNALLLCSHHLPVLNTHTVPEIVLSPL